MLDKEISSKIKSAITDRDHSVSWMLIKDNMEWGSVSMVWRWPNDSSNIYFHDHWNQGSLLSVSFLEVFSFLLLFLWVKNRKLLFCDYDRCMREMTDLCK